MNKGKQYIFIGLIVFISSLIYFNSGVAEASIYPLKENALSLPKDIYDEENDQATAGTIVTLSGIDFMLERLEDSIELYYEVPLQGVKKGSKLDLNIQYSEFLVKGSALTVIIDDNPIYSTDLNIETNEMEIEVPLEGDAITQGIHHMTIDFYGNIAEDHPENEENPVNWLTISAGSQLYLNTDDFSKRKNVLQDYPYPFVQSEQDKPVQSAIIIPDEQSTNILVAALKLANYLNNQVSTEDKIQIVKESDVTKISSHLIAIGTEKQWTGVIKDLFTSAKLTTSEEELTLSNYFLDFNEATKQMLFITAENEATINEKIRILTDEHLVRQLAGDEMKLTKIPITPKEEIKQYYSFEELNIPNLELTGERRMSQIYFLQMPAYMNVAENASLHLKLKVSDTLFQTEELIDRKEDAELVAYINGIPHSIAIDDLEKDIEESFYDVDLTIDPTTLQQESLIKIQFQANGLNDRKIGVPPNDEKWVFIRDDSYLHIATLSETIGGDFSLWPAPFVSVDDLSETTIILPNTYDQKMINQLLLLTNQLGSRTTLDELDLIFDQEVSEQELKDRHIILLGSLADHPSLKEYADQFIIESDDTGDLNVSAYEFVNETAKNIVWLQPSVWNDNKMMVMFSAVQSNDTGEFLSENIMGFLKENTIQTKIIVENMNGELFTHKQEKTTAAESGTAPQTYGESNSLDSPGNKKMLIGFIVIVAFGLIIFIYLYRKGKKNKIKTNKKK